MRASQFAAQRIARLSRGQTHRKRADTLPASSVQSSSLIRPVRIRARETRSASGHRGLGHPFAIVILEHQRIIDADPGAPFNCCTAHFRPFYDYGTVATENRLSKYSGRPPLGLCGRLPELNLIPIQIIDPGKATV